MKKALLVAAPAAAFLVPAAFAGGQHRVKLRLVPLPKQAIGSAVRGFAIAPNSGPVSNAAAASSTPDGTPASFKRLGRQGGYVVEWGNAFSGAPGITDVHTGIEQYKTPAAAKRGFAFWKKEDSKLARLDQPGFSVTNVLVHVPAVGKRRRFAYLTSYSASNIAPVSGIDEQVLAGRYILDVIVTAGTPAAAEALAPKLARKLDARLRLVLRGRLHGKPVKAPKLKAGPPAGGPDLAALALRGSDLVGKTTVDKRYVVDPAAVSDYSVFMLPAGPFDVLDQEIEWYPVANEASFFADFENAAALAQPETTALDLSSLGNGAQGSMFHGPQTEAGNAGQVFFSTGRLAEFIFMVGPTSVTADDVTSVAQAAASKIDAAGLGSP